MPGNVRAAASERSRNLSMVKATEEAIWPKKARYHAESRGCRRQRGARVPHGYTVTSHSVLDLQKSDFSFLKLFLQRYAVTYLFTFFFFFSIHAILPFVHIWLHNWCLSLQPQVGSPFLAGLKMYKMRPRAMKAGHLLQSQLDYGGSSLLSFTYFYFKYLQVLDSFSFKFVSIFYILKNAFWLRYSYHSFRFHIHLAYLAFLNRLEVGFNLTTSWLILLSIETSDQLFQFTSTILLCSIFWWRFFLAPFYFM